MVVGIVWADDGCKWEIWKLQDGSRDIWVNRRNKTKAKRSYNELFAERNIQEQLINDFSSETFPKIQRGQVWGLISLSHKNKGQWRASEEVGIVRLEE